MCAAEPAGVRRRKTGAAAPVVAMLERVLKDILVDRFNATPNPIQSAKEYAELR
jgi:hypothetical protein